MGKRKQILTAALLAAAFIAYGAEKVPMSLDSCLRYARLHAPDNIIERLETRSADAGVGIAASALMPQVGLNVNGNLSFGRNIDPETNTYDNKKTLSSGFGIGFNLPLFDGLVRVNALRSAKAQRLKQRNMQQYREDMVSFSVIKAFYEVEYCGTMRQLALSRLERDTRLRAETAAGLRAGMKSQADMAEVDAMVEAGNYELVNTTGLLDKAMLQLKALMGYPLDAEDPELMFDQQATAGTANPGFEDPRIKAASAETMQMHHELNGDRGEFWPEINFQAGISTSYFKMMGDRYEAPAFGRQWHDNMGQYLAVSLSFPIFDGLYRVRKLQRARTALHLARARLEQTETEVRRERMEAEMDLESALAEMKAAERMARAEETAYNATRRKFELGASSAIDLYTSGAKLQEAQATLTAKRIQVRINTITAGYYKGIPLITH